MANKSKKRIKHEQQVYVAKLERELKKLRSETMEYEVLELESRHLIAPTFDAAYEEKILGYTFEKACRDMAEKIMHSGAVKIDKTREFAPNRCGKVDCYKFALKVLKRRY